HANALPLLLLRAARAHPLPPLTPIPLPAPRPLPFPHTADVSALVARDANGQRHVLVLVAVDRHRVDAAHRDECRQRHRARARHRDRGQRSRQWRWEPGVRRTRRRPRTRTKRREEQRCRRGAGTQEAPTRGERGQLLQRQRGRAGCVGRAGRRRHRARV
ncbi:hypothetical protein LTR04_000427, partial [Oleoguttula sp. CCFEE 6159]